MRIPEFTRRELAVFGAAAGFSQPAFLVQAAQAPAQHNRLSEGFPPAKLASVVAPPEKWHPFPRASERGGWEALPSDVRESLIEEGARQLATEWPPLPATLFLEFARNGNRSRYERVRSQRREKLRELVVAECLEGKGRFLEEIGNGIWTTCEETYWGVPAHLGLQKRGPGLPDAAEPTVDLFAAETASLLAWTDYLLGRLLDKVSPLIRERIHLEVSRRLLTPNLERIDFWWMGLDPKLGRSVNNWNPWINSNWLTSVLLVERDEARRANAVHKILRSLDRFLDSYHGDGGCDEGPGYWGRAGASLFDCLELLYSASAGKIDFYEMPLVREIGRYIYRAHIHEDYYINFADASAKVSIPGDLVFRYGRRTGDEKMQALGAYAASGNGRPPRSDSIGRQLPGLFNLETLREAPRSQPLVRDVWLKGIQVVAARRREGSAEGLYLAAKGGHNAESHNHNDVGNFIVYADGQPVFVDVGVETYTAKTFSSRRYEIWTMQSAWHNLPTVNGVMQAAGRQFAASKVSYRAGDQTAEFALDIAGAYPAEAAIASWQRTLRLDRASNWIEVIDAYSLSKPAASIAWSLVTPCKVSRSGAGELTLSGESFRTGTVKLTYDASALEADTEEARIEDARLKAVWGDRLYRILLTAKNPPTQARRTLRIVQ